VKLERQQDGLPLSTNAIALRHRRDRGRVRHFKTCQCVVDYPKFSLNQGEMLGVSALLAIQEFPFQFEKFGGRHRNPFEVQTFQINAISPPTFLSDIDASKVFVGG
jgi:hypothetical protein